MNSNLRVTFSNKMIHKILSYLSTYLMQNETLNKKSTKEFQDVLNETLSKTNYLKFHNDLQKWWCGDIKYFVINNFEISGLSLRLYKASFHTIGNKLLPIDEQKIAGVYLRYRDVLTSQSKTIKLGDTSLTNIPTLVKAAIQHKSANHIGIKVLEKYSHKSTSLVSTSSLSEFLYSEYLDVQRYENPKTGMTKLKIIESNFGYLLDKPISDINAVTIREWMRTKERVLTKRQLAAGDSLWNIKPSTMKGIICTIRACVQLAKEKGVIQDHDLYSLPRIRVDNQVIRYLSEQEELRLFDVINRRNKKKHNQRVSTINHRLQRALKPPVSLADCYFVDHVSPFIILFKETGIRPGTLFNSKWSDVDLESKFFHIRKSLDKRGLSNFIPLNDLALKTLEEWRKHCIHKESSKFFKSKSDSWLFPSPENPENQITTIKKSWQKILSEAQIDNFRLYDLRHDFASKVMMKTGNIYMVSQLLNHKQIETTKRYAHLMDQSRFDAVRQLDINRNEKALPDFLK
jgi:integrase